MFTGLGTELADGFSGPGTLRADGDETNDPTPADTGALYTGLTRTAVAAVRLWASFPNDVRFFSRSPDEKKNRQKFDGNTAVLKGDSAHHDPSAPGLSLIQNEIITVIGGAVSPRDN